MESFTNSDHIMQSEERCPICESVYAAAGSKRRTRLDCGHGQCLDCTQLADTCARCVENPEEERTSGKVQMTQTMLENERFPLHVAARLGLYEELMVLLYKGYQIDSRQEDGLTPLHVACMEGQWLTAQVLMDRNADPNVLQPDLGRSCLHYAAMNRTWDFHCDELILSVCKKLDVNLCDTHGRTALDYAIRHGTSIVPDLISAGAHSGLTALTNAITSNQVRELKLILDDVDFEHLDPQRKMDFMLDSLTQNHPEILSALLSAGGLPGVSNTQLLSLLITAVHRGHEDIVKMLLHAQVPADDDSHTPIMMAISDGNFEITQALLKAGAPANGKYYPLLLEGIRRGQINIIRLLLKYCPANTFSGNEKIELFSEAIKHGNKSILQSVLSTLRIDGVNAEDRVELLMETIRRNSQDHAEVLLEEIHPSRVSLMVLLKEAVAQGNMTVVRLLLEKGAPLDLAVVDGPLYQAAAAKHVDIMDFMMSFITPEAAATSVGNPCKRAKTDSQTHTSSSVQTASQTASILKDVIVADMPILHYAAHCGYTELVKVLLDFCPSLMSVTDQSGKESIYKAVHGNHIQTVYALVDAAHSTLSGEVIANLVAVAPDTRKQIISAALHRLPPPPDVMDRGDWMRLLFKNGRNLIKLSHEMDLAKPQDSRYTFVPVVPVDATTARMRVDDVQGVYQMFPTDGVKRGNVVIICNMTFHDHHARGQRLGAEKDAMRLKRLFETFNLNVTLHTDCTAEAIRRTLTGVKKESDPDHQIFVLIIMSHGGPGYIEGTDGQLIYVERDLLEQFDGDNWLTMRGKPKLFLIQSCRGKRSASFIDDTLNDSTTQEAWATSTDIHPKGDILVVYSTCARYASFRTEEHGSWFIEELVLAFELFSHQDHVEDIVKKANSMLAMRKAFNTAGIQVAQITSTLRSKLYLLRRPAGSSTDFCEKRSKSVYTLTDKFGYDREISAKEYRRSSSW